MKIHGNKREWKSPFWVNLRNHFCPNCDEIVNATTESKVVNSKSPEAKNHDFSLDFDTNLAGNVKFTWTVFECPVCKRRFSIEEMKQIEENEKEQNKRPKSAYRKKKLTFRDLAPVFSAVLIFIAVILFLIMVFSVA
ncbi:MAG: hypothetical protein IJW21_03885 [Clostridia bacterium]|nr:hypothetical protein [Clostridia bacterium]